MGEIDDVGRPAGAEQRADGAAADAGGNGPRARYLLVRADAEDVAEPEEHRERAERAQDGSGRQFEQRESTDARADDAEREQKLDLLPVGVLTVGTAQHERSGE